MRLIRRFFAAVTLPLLFTMIGCGGSDSGPTTPSPSPAPAVSPIPNPSVSPTPNPGVVTGRVIAIYPNQGPTTGGTAFQIRTQNIDYVTYSRYKVFFGNAEATDLDKTPPTDGYIYLTGKTPAGTGTVRPVVRFYNKAGNTIGEFSPTLQFSTDFVYVAPSS